jgi:hypothetical protein
MTQRMYAHVNKWIKKRNNKEYGLGIILVGVIGMLKESILDQCTKADYICQQTIKNKVLREMTVS